MVNHETASYGFTLDIERLEEVVLKVYEAAERKKGIFSDGIERFMPQYNLSNY